jgi:hypothetical protein
MWSCGALNVVCKLMFAGTCIFTYPTQCHIGMLLYLCMYCSTCAALPRTPPAAHWATPSVSRLQMSKSPWCVSVGKADENVQCSDHLYTPALNLYIVYITGLLAYISYNSRYTMSWPTMRVVTTAQYMCGLVREMQSLAVSFLRPCVVCAPCLVALMRDITALYLFVE